MGVGSGGQGAVATLDFYTWYKYCRRALKVLFFGLFCYFSVFFTVDPLPWKRLNSAIFRYFLLIFDLLFFR